MEDQVECYFFDSLGGVPTARMFEFSSLLRDYFDRVLLLMWIPLFWFMAAGTGVTDLPRACYEIVLSFGSYLFIGFCC